MIHKTLIGGTAYEIIGGETLVDGTAYSIKNGKILADSTVYKITVRGFKPIFELGTVTMEYDSLFKIYTLYFDLSEPINNYMLANTLMINGEIFIFPYLLGLSSDTVNARSNKDQGGVFPTTDGEIMFQISENNLLIRSYNDLGTCNITIGIMR